MVSLWAQALVLVVLLQIGLSSPVHVLRTWPSRRQELLRPNIIQRSMGTGGSDTALLSVLLLLSKKLYLTFPRSRFWVAHHWLAPCSPQETTSPKTELTVGFPWKGTLVLRRVLQSPLRFSQRHREVRLEDGWVPE